MAHLKLLFYAVNYSNCVCFHCVSFAVLIFLFNMTRYTVNEGGPAIQICVDLDEGVVGPTGETINVASVGGTAMGKTFADRVLSKWGKSMKYPSSKLHNVFPKGVLCSPRPLPPSYISFLHLPFQFVDGTEPSQTIWLQWTLCKIFAF